MRNDAWFLVGLIAELFAYMWTYDPENCKDQPDRELFIWAVLFSRMRLATIFWKTCPDQIGAALIANLMFKSMAHKADIAEKLQLASELIKNAGFVYFLVTHIVPKLYTDCMTLTCDCNESP